MSTKRLPRTARKPYGPNGLRPHIVRAANAVSTKCLPRKHFSINFRVLTALFAFFEPNWAGDRGVVLEGGSSSKYDASSQI